MNGLPQAIFEIDHPGSDQESPPELEKAPKAAPKSNGQEPGYTFEELVQRLLAQPVSKTDTKFTSIFLALYRIFASPSQLLDSIIQRFDSLSRDPMPQTLMAAAQQRHLDIIVLWISLYPGDFAYDHTRQKLDAFAARLDSSRLFAAAARDITANLDAIVEDDDTYWAFSDGERTPGSLTRSISSMNISSNSSIQSQGSSHTYIGSPTIASSHNMLTMVEQASRAASFLTPTDKFPLSKMQWHVLMDQSEEVIAREMTRMDWVMFCSIRPRDLVRQVMLNDRQKVDYRSLDNVHRMVEHFNHLAMWVVNFILLRDKPKHRSFMLEKMMKIARELRKINNYNSLGAVLAGISKSSVQRLHATKELIDPAVGRDYMKLEILMSPQKSYSAYRLAWENTSAERIPYFPLHRRDLVSASEGNRTFIELADGDAKVGGKVAPTDLRGRLINWKKFEIMGNVVVSLQTAKEAPYPAFTRCDEVKSLVVDIRIEQEEDVRLASDFFNPNSI
jgi:hypothetical protein